MVGGRRTGLERPHSMDELRRGSGDRWGCSCADCAIDRASTPALSATVADDAIGHVVLDRVDVAVLERRSIERFAPQLDVAAGVDQMDGDANARTPPSGRCRP